jgi:hypothetical protein
MFIFNPTHLPGLQTICQTIISIPCPRFILTSADHIKNLPFIIFNFIYANLNTG